MEDLGRDGNSHIPVTGIDYIPSVYHEIISEAGAGTPDRACANDPLRILDYRPDAGHRRRYSFTRPDQGHNQRPSFRGCITLDEICNSGARRTRSGVAWQQHLCR